MQGIAASCWNIWRDCNNRLFKDTARSTKVCLGVITSDIKSWTRSSTDDSMEGGDDTSLTQSEDPMLREP